MNAMRSNRLLVTSLVALALAVGGASIVVADGGPPATGPHAAAGGSGHANATANHTAYVTALRALVNATHAAFRENRTLALAAFHGSMNATRAAYLASKNATLDACHDGKPDMKNASREEKTAFAKCVHDGLKPLKEKAHADIRAAQEKFRSTMETARKAALDSFASGRAALRAQYGIGGGA